MSIPTAGPIYVLEFADHVARHWRVVRWEDWRVAHELVGRKLEFKGNPPRCTPACGDPSEVVDYLVACVLEHFARCAR